MSIPLNDTQDYDLIVEKDNTLYKVQVKATTRKINGNYSVSLKSCGGTVGKIYKTVKDSNCDLLFVVCEDMTLYLIPRTEIKQRSALSLYKDKSKFNNNDFDSSKFIVKM